MAQSLVIVESPTKAKSLFLRQNRQQAAWAAGWNGCRMAACDGWKKLVEHPALLACTLRRPYDEHAKKPVTSQQVDCDCAIFTLNLY